MKLLDDTIASMPIARPVPTERPSSSLTDYGRQLRGRFRGRETWKRVTRTTRPDASWPLAAGWS
jgi:hypothetical protein